MSIQVLAKTEVLGTPVDAVYQKHDKKQYLLVYGHADNPKKVSLGELITDLAKTISFGDLKADDIEKTLPDWLKDVKVSLYHVYFLHESGSGATGTKPSKEYALWLDLTYEKKEPQKASIFEFKSLSLRLWSTQNEKVLEEMKINEINALLKGAGVPVDQKKIEQ